MADLPVCVLGMGRSGTSMTARVLNLLGVDLGPEAGFVPASAHNAKGYWERRAIYELNEALLAAFGGDYANPPHLEPGWEKSPSLEAYRRRARQVLDESFAGSELWGLKDARLSLTLPFWREVVPRMRYAICIRDPVEVAASFAEYPGDESFATADWFDLWRRSTATALLHTRQEQRELVFFDLYFEDLRAQVDNLARFVGRPVTEDAWNAIRAFVDAGLRHHRHAGAAPPDGEPAAVLYRALRQLARAGAPSGETERLAQQALDDTARTAEAARRPQPSVPASDDRVRRCVSSLPDDLSPGKGITFGIERDGWLERSSLTTLRAGGAARLLLQADVLPVKDQHLEVRVDGCAVASQPVGPGRLDLSCDLPVARRPRCVELLWATTMPLAAPDVRHAAARLEFIGLGP